MWWVHDPFTASLWVGGSMLLFAVTWMALRLQVRQLEDRLAAEDGFAGVLTKRPRGECSLDFGKSLSLLFLRLSTTRKDKHFT